MDAEYAKAINVYVGTESVTLSKTSQVHESPISRGELSVPLVNSNSILPVGC